MAQALSEGRPIDETWTDIRTVTDLILRVSRCTAQATGRAKSQVTVGHRCQRLNLSSMSNKDKAAVMDHPFSSTDLFGSAAFEAIQ